MSLAMFAAPFDDNPSNEISNNKNMSNNKKPAHNKTQRKHSKYDMDNNKVNSVLEEIHNNSTEDDENHLGDFNPPPKPDSAGVGKTIATEQTNALNQQKNTEMFRIMGNAPQPNTPTDIGYSYNKQIDQKTVDEYYKKILPGYDSTRQNVNKPYYNATTYGSQATAYGSHQQSTGEQDVLLQKLNYMIHLLEEKQDEKTNNVMEEVILYSFLGIFIIFVVDSFARVGKYVR
jgi:hypothetical protein